MIKSKRRLMYLGIALVAGVALAAGVVFMMGDDADTTAQGSKITTTAAASQNAAASAADPLAVDPAKQEPMLDKFTPKDPFIPLGVASSSSSSTTSTTTQTTLYAKVTMNGTSYSAVKGDKLPPSDSVFTVSNVTSSAVTFTLISGEFENGDTSISVNVGESVKVVKAGGSSYTIKVTSISSSSDSGTDDSGHSISVLSISSSNGTPVVTLEVDDKTYADKKVGDTFGTGWGEIKIVAINESAQTVTLMHGDQTITLNAGQVVVK